MKLFYMKGACSQAPHIVLHELGIPFEPVPVDLRRGAQPELLAVNPLGAVPVLVLDNGESIREVAVILQYLADLKAEAGLAPKQGTWERLRLQEMLNFIATELHKGFSPLFGAEYMASTDEAQAEIRRYTKEGLMERFAILESKLGSRDYLMPQGYSVADAYLYVMLSWAGFFAMDLKPCPNLLGLMKRVRERPATQAALKVEGLLK